MPDAKPDQLETAITMALAAPGPVIVNVLLRIGSGPVRLIVPIAVMLIVWLPGLVASMIARFSEPVPVSFVFVTVNASACAMPDCHATSARTVSERVLMAIR